MIKPKDNYRIYDSQKTGWDVSQPECKLKSPQKSPGNDVNFKLEWARAISVAEQALSACIEQYLRNIIEQVDSNIYKKISNIFRKLQGSCDDPKETITIIISDANKERLRVNEENRKRKRDFKNNNDGEKPNKKSKKNNKDK